MFTSKIFADHPEYLNDVYGVNYTLLGPRMSGWGTTSAPFCDSLMLWCATHWPLARRSTEIGMVLSTIRACLARMLETSQYKVFHLGSGRCKDFDVLDKAIHEKKGSELGEDGYEPAYIAVRVAFENVGLLEVLSKLPKILRVLRKACIVLHDLDIAVDCAYISNRQRKKEFLFSQGLTQEDIVNDRHSVGDNCISWQWTVPFLEDVPLRVKVYNKFVQMLESRELRSKLGSQLHHLVANTDAGFQERLLKHRSTGMSRVEVTIYGSRLYKEATYAKIMASVLDYLKPCPAFRVSFDKQWEALASRITQMVAVYIPETQTFAYCHWWNSLTKRMQGITKTKITTADVKLHLANFSFNDRPIHYLVVKQKGEKEYEVTKHTIYKRAKGCTAITLVPGIAESLSPYRKDLDQRALEFREVGITSAQNITLEWPMSRLRRDRDDKLAQIVRCKDKATTKDDANSPLVCLQKVQMSLYKADYTSMTVGKAYTVVAYGSGDFRGKHYLCLKLQGGIFVRCSPGMEEVVYPRLESHGRFGIRVTRVKKVRGERDVECEILDY